MPSGFEKILKRTRRGVTHDKKEGAEEKAAKDGDEDNKPKEEKKAEESDGEQETDEKEKENKEKKEEGEGDKDWKQKIYNFFMEPNGGGPNYENWLKLVVLGGLTGYYAFFMQSPSQEVTYMDFVHNYLSQNKVEMITLCENKNNLSYKYRAIIETTEGAKVHLVLPQVENFLMKLDMAQREMGKDPS